MGDNSNYEKYPICDTDIWVNSCLSNIVEDLFKVRMKILVSDIFEKEIEKWKKSRTHSKVYEKFIQSKNQNRILVISYNEDIDSEDKLILEHRLTELGFADYSSLEKNKGEYVSALYTECFSIPFMKSNDSEFCYLGSGKKQFPGLEVRNWDMTLKDIIKTKEKIKKIQKTLKIEQKNMRQSQIEYKEEYNLEDKLDKLAEKYQRIK